MEKQVTHIITDELELKFPPSVEFDAYGNIQGMAICRNLPLTDYGSEWYISAEMCYKENDEFYLDDEHRPYEGGMSRQSAEKCNAELIWLLNHYTELTT